MKKHNKEAVSAVIGVILMVAITVAMTATVFVYVNNMLGETGTVTPEIMAHQQILPNKGLEVVKADFGINWDDIILTHGTKPTGEEVTAGDFILFTGDETNDTMSMVFEPTNTLIGMWKFGAGSGTGGGGSTPPPEPPTVTRVESMTDELGSPSDTTISFTQPQEGNLLVVITGHRQQSGSSISTPSISGWNLAGVYAHLPWTSGDRRVIGILYKVAGPSEPTDVTISWTNAETRTDSVAVILQEFTGATSYSLIGAQGVSDDTDELALPTVSAGGNANVLGVAGVVMRGSSGAFDDPWTNGFTQVVEHVDSGMSGGSAWTYTTTSSASMQTTASWTTGQDCAGMLALFACN